MIATGFALIAAVLAAAPAPDAAARAKAIAPFVDEQTMLVARFDVTQVDFEPLLRRANKAMRELAGPDVPQADRQFAEAKAKADQWLVAFAKAGGRDLYVIGPMDVFPAVVVVVPLGERGDAEELSKLLGVRNQTTTAPTRPNGAPFSPEVARCIGGMLLVGAREAVERIAKTTPAARPELTKAFAAAGDGAAQLLILPTNDSRRVIAELMPRLPDALGGGPSSALTDGMRWAALGAALKPDLSVTAVIQSTDPGAAEAMGGVIKRIYASLAAKPRGELMQFVDTGDILAMLRWRVEGSRLTLSIDAARLDKLMAEVIAPSLRRARYLAMRAISAANFNAIGKALALYTIDHEGAFPENLQVLVEKKYLNARALVNPAHPDRKPAYVYLPPRKPPVPAAAETLVAYEAHDKWGEGVNVLFYDGLVEFLRDRARFEKLLKQVKAAPAANP